jgi:nucleoside-diphosphate-sugar epimerase
VSASDVPGPSGQGGRVLVTGATGFVGRAVVAALRERGRAARAVVRAGPAAPDTAIVPDIGPDTDWDAALEGIDAVIHLAARVHVMHETAADPLADFRRTNLHGSARLAEAAARAGVRRLVFASTVKVLGEATPPDAPFGDDSPARPVDPYGISKLEAERALAAIGASSGLEVTVLRPPLIHGPGVGGNMARLLGWIASGRPLPLGAVDNRRSLIALDNFADALIRAADHPAAAGRCFLVADAPDLSTPELVRRLAAAMGRPARLVPVPVSWMRGAARLAGAGAALERLVGSLRVDASGFGRTIGGPPPLDVDAALAATARAFLARGR